MKKEKVGQENVSPPQLQDKKYVFEYYCVTQLASNFDYENLLGSQKGKPIFDLDTFPLHSNPTAAKQEIPSILRNMNKWIFPEGLKVIWKEDGKFSVLSEFYRNPAAKISSAIHEINYFVLTDFASGQRFYCTSAYFYERIVIIESTQSVVEVFIPRAHVIISRASFFSSHKSLIGYLLQVHRARESGDEGRVIQVEKDEGKRTFGIEQWKLFEFYVQFAFNHALIENKNERIMLHFHPSHNTVSYMTRNHPENRFAAIAHPSNIFFDSIIFHHSPYNLLQLATALLLESQILLVSSRSNSLALFAENLLELISPMKWVGVYIPNMVSKIMFDYDTTSLPFLIGIKRSFFKPTEEWKKRVRTKRIVVYDVDENHFLFTSTHEKCELPIESRSYFMNKINTVIGDIKFYEEEYFNEGVLRFKQYFYNLILLTFNGMIKYISRVNKSDNINLNNEDQITQQNLQASQSLVYSNSDCWKNNSMCTSSYPSFNFDDYIESFSPDSRYFYEHATATKMFSELIKDCYYAAHNPNKYIESMSAKQIDSTYGAILTFVNDAIAFESAANPDAHVSSSLQHRLSALSSFSSASSSERNSNQTNNRIGTLEEIQNAYINTAKLDTNIRHISANDFVADYLEALLAEEENIPADREQKNSLQSCFISSFLNSALDLQKELLIGTANGAAGAAVGGGGGTNGNGQLGGPRPKRVLSSQLTPKMDIFKEDENQGFESKELFFKHYLERKYRNAPPAGSGTANATSTQVKKNNISGVNNNTSNLTSPKINHQNGEASQSFNEDLWKITTSEDVLADASNKQSSQANVINKKVIRQLSLFERKDRLCRYQEIDEEENVRAKRYLTRFEGGLSTVAEVTSAYSGFPQKTARKNSLKEFFKINNQMNPILDQNNAFEKIEDFLFYQIDK